MDPTTMHAGGPAVRIDALDMFVELLSQVEDDASSDAFYSRLCEATCASENALMSIPYAPAARASRSKRTA